MRRLILEEPYSAAAEWSRRLSLFALALTPIAIVLSRAQIVDAAAALAVFGAAIFIACLAVLLACAAAVIIWRTGRRGAGVVVMSLLLSVALLAFPLWLAIQAARLPIINDVSTDLIDPPEFPRSSRALAARGGLVHGALSEEFRESQRLAYPTIQPIVIDIEIDEAWQLVQRAVAARGFRVIEQTRPGGRSGVGRVEAVDRTLIMGFSDDVTIRLRPLAGQTRIDMRSASRVGRHDFGANARRIQRFAQEVQAQLDAR
jgi:uncharacterized protein (DUF1499 family)